MSENYQKCFDELTKLSLEKKKLDEKHQKAGWALRHEVEPMPLPEFWECVETLRKSLMSRQRGRWGWNLESAFWNIRVSKPQMTLYRFAKRWKLIADSLRDPLGDMKLEYRGDDSWGDLIDASPLLGETIYNQLLKGTYKTEKELMSSFNTYCIMKQDGKYLDVVQKNADHMVRSVLNGENYFVTKLHEKALEAFTDYAE